MEIDLAQLDGSAVGGDLLRAAICIVGGGIAGLTLAQKLVALRHEVLVLEAGGHAREDFSAAEQAGVAHPGTSEPRPRALGGTSLTWGGQLLPFPRGGGSWAVSAGEMDGFTREAEELLGVDALPYGAAAFFEKTRQPAPALVQQIAGVEGWLSKFAPFGQRNLAQTVGRKLGAHSRARVVLHATVTEILLAPGREHVEAVVVRASGRSVRVEAALFVVAAGTVETVRLLLASRSVGAEGVGNGYDQVGRNFHDHLTVAAATLRGAARTELLKAARPWVYGSTVHALKLAGSRELEERLGLLPVLAHVTMDEPESSGVGALRGLLRARQQGGATAGAWAVLPRAPGAAADALRLVLSSRMRHRRYVSAQASVQLRLNAAQRTPSASRITISSDGKPVVDWRVQAEELTTLHRFARHLREHVRIDGVEWNEGLFAPDAEELVAQLDDARHPMGGAVMGIDARSSVVDGDLRVHGLRNLFVASAAVFPDGSPQLPTLPLMVLTLRLAQHLHSFH